MFIDVNEFKTEATDAKMILAALKKAEETGEAVVIPKRNARTGKDIWNIDQTITLESDTVLILQGCHLRLADGAICNMFSNSHSRGKTATDESSRQSNIHIMGIGKAVLDGGNHNGLYETNGIARSVKKDTTHHVTENCMIFMQNADNLILENLTVRDQRYWAFCFFSCAYSRVSNIRLESHGNVPNQDGVDLCKGCHDFIVENITGCTGDNAIALLATDDEIYCGTGEDKRKGDIYNVAIRNIMVYGIGGCALMRLLNHDGYRIYNIRIDNVIETSPWSEKDAPLAQNPDLIIKTDEEGNPLPFRRIIPGEIGYRAEAAIIIGESYWYLNSKAQHGDTYGISVSNVMTHARFAIFVNNTLMDSSFENIRVFGNGYMLAYFGEGQVENVRFNNAYADKTAKPHPDDEHIYVDWNKTKADGFAGIYFNQTKVKNLSFRNVDWQGSGLQSFFGGQAEGEIICSDLQCGNIPLTLDKNLNVIQK